MDNYHITLAETFYLNNRDWLGLITGNNGIGPNKVYLTKDITILFYVASQATSLLVEECCDDYVWYLMRQ